MVHDLSPFIYKFPATSFWGDNFGFRWYGFAYILGFICAYRIISWLAERQRAGMNYTMVSDFITYAAIGTLVGGRLGYCLFYDPNLFFSFRPTIPFWGVLAVNEGGMASHGGIIGIIIACILFARKSGLNYVYLLDLAAVTGPIGVFFGRIANFINGELVGRPSAPDFPLAVKFPTDILNWPSQEFDRLSTLTPAIDKMGVASAKWSELLAGFRTDASVRDQVYGLLNKIIFEIQNGNTAVKEALGTVLDPRHPSQLYAAAGEGLLTFLILFFLMRKARKPGFVAGSFIIIYAIVRICDEQFRMPDAHIGYQLFGLTRGQWLSIAMLLSGFVALFYWMRTQSQTIFGWKRGESVKVSRR